MGGEVADRDLALPGPGIPRQAAAGKGGRATCQGAGRGGAQGGGQGGGQGGRHVVRLKVQLGAGRISRIADPTGWLACVWQATGQAEAVLVETCNLHGYIVPESASFDQDVKATPDPVQAAADAMRSLAAGRGQRCVEMCSGGSFLWCLLMGMQASHE